MNKIKSLIVIILASMVMFSCEKETEEPTLNNSTTMSTNDLTVYNKIISFKGKLDAVRANDGLITKTGEQPLSVDSTVWYLEALLNFTKARAEIFYNTNTIDSVFKTITLNENELVEWDDMLEMYDALEDSIDTKLAEIETETKVLKLADISVETLDGVVTIKMVTVIYWVIPGCPLSNTETSWFWGKKLGTCNGDYSGVYDATDRLEYVANGNGTSLVSGSCYFTDIDCSEQFFLDYPHNNNDVLSYGVSNHYLFYYVDNTNNFEPCFIPSDLSYFISGVNFVVNDMLPFGYDKLHTDVSWSQTQPLSGLATAKWHNVRLTFGIYHNGYPID